jgi:general secretion pathway protein D
MLAASDVSAQTPSSSASPAASSASASNVAKTPSAEDLIARVRGAISVKDYHTAVQAFRSASQLSRSQPQYAGELAKLRKQLEQIGIDGALLAMPPQPTQPTMQRLPEVDDDLALPIASAGLTTPESRKKEALRLVAIGRAALDRGDVRTALKFARQAEALKVPEKDFATGEPRVWQLVLDAESAGRRSGIALTSGLAGQTVGDSGVQPAGGAVTPGGQNAVAQMLFSADADSAPAASKGQVQQVQGISPLPPTEDGYAERMYREGLEALGKGDSATARERFKEAWAHEAELDPATRNQLKDKLTLLQPKRLPASPNTAPAEMTPIEKAELEAQEKARRLFREVTAELANTEQMRTTVPLDALDELERLRRRVDGADVDEQAKRSISMMVDRAISEQKKYIDANRAKIDLELQNDAVRAELATEQAREARIDEEISALVNTFNGLIKERRFQEAEVIAKQVQELKPDDPIAVSMFHTSRMGTRLLMDEEVRDAKELAFVDSLIDVDRSAIAIDPDLPMTLPEAQDWEALSRRRLRALNDGDSRLSAAEQVIQQKLMNEVNVKYANRPLTEVLNELSAVTGVPMVIDERALGAIRVTPETPVTLELPNSIKLKSALNLILNKMELTYVIENDVLSITSMEAKRSKVYPKTYRVTDLVTPIPNFTSSYEDGLAGALRAAYQMSNPQADVQVVPVSMTDLGTGMAKNALPSSMNPDVLGQYHSMGAQGGFGLNNPPMAGGGGGSFADFQSLIDLIQTTVVPDTWEALGGPSTMAPYPQNLSLVISTTSDVHDQIADLLESLRRLQNLQITIEVRFITLADSFAEQIGVDFQVQFDDNVYGLPYDDEGPSVAIGWNGIDGLPTPDLDIRLDNGSFGLSPPFGAAGLGTPSTIGFAILSDIEAFFFLQAAQSDNRSNVMQAPKVTLFDGQFATISDQTQRPFVISITPVVGDFAVAQQPVIVVLNEGTQLNVQGIVSDDKRFVRLTLVPFFSQIGEVDTFTYEGRRSTRSRSRNEDDTNGDGVVDEDDAVDEEENEEIVEGTTVQLPTFAFTSVSTTVSVPDGGTILLGGIKRLAEGRVERGIPVLSKIPYVSRLFRNVSAGRDASSLMLMVTPRIIIQEEEEEAQTGFNPNRS